MNFRSLIWTYKRFSLPKKLATGVAAIAGVGALIGIPILSLNPMRPPTEINEDAYYKAQVKDQSLAGQDIAPSQSNTNLDSATPAEIPISSSNSAQVPNSSLGSNSSEPNTSENGSTEETSPASSIDTGSSPSVPNNSALGGNSSGLDTSENGNIDQTSRGSSIGTGSSTNPYSKPLPSGYAPSGSLSANPYNASGTISSPSGSTLSTRYSLPIPTSANSYNLQPSAGNVYSDPNSQSSSESGQNSLPATGNTPGIPSTSASAGTLNGASEDFNQPTPTTSAGSANSGL